MKFRLVNWTFMREIGPMRGMIRYGILQFRKRVLRKDSRMRLPTGRSLILPRQSQTSTEIYVSNANVDWGSEALFARFADRERDFFDIGAHIGYYAVYLSPLVRRAYAFEPDPRNLPGLHQNASISPNIQVVETAVSSRDGFANFFGGSSSSIGSLNDQGGPSTKVPITTVDTFVAQHAAINVGLIKTDIEGHDLEALRGMEKTIARFQPLILTECDLSAELSQLCARWNYSVFAFIREQKSRKPHFIELRPTRSPHDSAKMLFLVPENLRSNFAHLAEN